MDKIYDLVIIGSGPAGLSAAIYAKRAGLDFIVLKDKYTLGSQIVNTYEIDNYIGFSKISGQDLYDNMKAHATSLDIEIIEQKAIDIKDEQLKIKQVIAKENIYNTKTIILATGANPKRLGCKGETEYQGMGVSYCATCDGAFYKDKICVVVGGGNVAVEDAIFLSRICTKVYLLVRKNVMRADKVLQDELLSKKNVEVLYNTEIKEIKANDFVESVDIVNNISDVSINMKTDGVFIAVGASPETNILSGKVDMKDNYVIADETCETSVSGIFACGDIRTKQLRQVITAASDGANAITSIRNYLIKSK